MEEQKIEIFEKNDSKIITILEEEKKEKEKLTEMEIEDKENIIFQENEGNLIF